MSATMSEAALARQFQRGARDRRAANAYGHSNEDMAFAEGIDRRQAKDAYDRGWHRPCAHQNS
jgi:hypothetical protein